MDSLLLILLHFDAMTFSYVKGSIMQGLVIVLYSLDFWYASMYSIQPTASLSVHYDVLVATLSLH